MWDSLLAHVIRLWSAQPVKLSSVLAHTSLSHSIIPPLSNPVSKLQFNWDLPPPNSCTSPQSPLLFTEKTLSQPHYLNIPTQMIAPYLLVLFDISASLSMALEKNCTLNLNFTSLYYLLSYSFLVSFQFSPSSWNCDGIQN